MESSANAPADAGQAMTVRLNVHDARGGALFASGLQPADAPAPGSMTESISRAMRRFGTRGCAGRRAQQPGGHPGSSPGGRAGPANSLPGGRPRGHDPGRRRGQMNQTGDRVGPAVQGTQPGPSGDVTGPMDCSVDILGGGPRGALPVGVPRVQRDHGPDPRRVYVRNPDGSPVLDSTSIAVDVTDVTFS
jgi:hypothetical protein